jgi:hypothetical protein
VIAGVVIVDEVDESIATAGAAVSKTKVVVTVELVKPSFVASALTLMVPSVNVLKLPEDSTTATGEPVPETV